MNVFQDIPMKDIKFDFNEISKSMASTKTNSLTESMINILGFSTLDVEDEKNEMVAFSLIAAC